MKTAAAEVCPGSAVQGTLGLLPIVSRPKLKVPRGKGFYILDLSDVYKSLARPLYVVILHTAQHPVKEPFFLSILFFLLHFLLSSISP
jgi:hypothetical protein